MEHRLTKMSDGWKCLTCTQTWRSKTKTDCPGVVVYENGKQPDHLVRPDILFEKGLKLADKQPIAAVVGYHQKPLYDINACVPHEIKIDFNEGKYKFVEQPLGFTIWRVSGHSWSMIFEDTWFHCGKYASEVSLYNWKTGLLRAVEYFVDELLPSANKSEAEQAEHYISSALSKRFYLQWKRIIDTLKAQKNEVEELSRLMFASTQHDSSLLHLPDLYTEKYQYVRTDLRKYHACRMYAANLTTEEGALDKLGAWRQQLTPTVPNKALNKTLDKYPVGMAYTQMLRLSTINLQEPITNRLKLIFVLCASDHHNWGLHEKTVINASVEMIQECARLRNRELKTQSKIRAIGEVASYILDYPEAYNGDLAGLARRSDEWHQRFDSVHSDMLPADTPLVMPLAVDLAALETKGITVLKTAGDCYQEHEKMRHCVHTYASKAAKGLCYLFHVEKVVEEQKYMATIEVSPQGYIVQAHGPSNQKNPACFYGVEELNKVFKHD